MSDLVSVAKITKTRGLKGEVVCHLLTDFPERFNGLESVTALTPDGKRSELKLEDHWFQNGRVILRFTGFDTIEKAELLRGAEICVPESESVDLGDDEFFDWQLEGCYAELIGGTKLGAVVDVMRTGGTELLVVKGETKDYLVPFAAAICVEVDIESKLIKVDPPEGLLEF